MGQGGTCFALLPLNIHMIFWISSGTILRFYSMNTFCMLPQPSHVGIYFATVWAWEVARHSSTILLFMLLSYVLPQTGVGVVELVTLIAGQRFLWT